MQDSKTGGVYGAAVTDAAKGADLFAAPVQVTPIDLEATVSFAAMMARLSYFYQEYDTEAATAYLKAADRAFTCYLNNRKDAQGPGAFKAAAQLYRATGSDSYSDFMEEFFERSDFNELFEKNENVFLGSVTYLSINEKVDVERCSALMKLLMASSEEIAERASKSGYLVSDMGSGSDFKKMLSDMRILSITNHIIYNYEYTTIIENHIHYLAGMNPEAVNYLTSGTQRSFAEAEVSGIMNDPENDALLVFMLSVLEQ
jgi:endoglucanase